MTLGELAKQVGAELVGDPSLVLRGVAGIREAEPGDITLLAHPKYEAWLQSSRASAVIRKDRASAEGRPGLCGKDPYLIFAEVLRVWAPTAPAGPGGVHPQAIVAPGARLGANVSIGPFTVVEDDVEIGARALVESGVFLGRGCRLGEDVHLYPSVVVREFCELGARVIVHAGAVVGSDGFGYAFDGRSHRKVPQIGRVVVEDDVEIGANSTLDRATIGVTRIGRGTKIDNLVHIAHNVEIGPLSILCAQSGISGSTKLGQGVVLAGQSGLVGHIELGDGARVAAQSGVTKSVPAGETVSGYPARSHAKTQRNYAAQGKLPAALTKLRELERRIAALEQGEGEPRGAAPPPPKEKR